MEPERNYLIWFKKKLESMGATTNLASSGVSTSATRAWFNDAVANCGPTFSGWHESNTFGLGSLKRAIRSAYQIPDDREIVLTPGASGGIRLIYEVLLAGEPHAEVILETPIYQPLAEIPRKFGARRVNVPRAGLLSAIQKLASTATTAVVLSNLHNPTGHAVSNDTIVRIAEHLDTVSPRSLLVVDETFNDLGSEAGRTAVGLHERIAVIGSLSKVYGLSQLRCGWVVASRKILPHLAEESALYQNVGCVLSEILSTLAFEKLNEFRHAARGHVDTNRVILSNWLECIAPSGLLADVSVPAGCVFFPKLIGLPPADEVVHRLEADFGVLTVPGAFFGDGFRDHIRVGFGGGRDQLEIGLSRLADGLSAIAAGR